MPLSRIERAGCSSGFARNCASRSGEALIRIQSTPFSLTAIEDWVRGNTSPVWLRAWVQFAQLQFHCGSPPPAPEPRILIFMSRAPGAAAHTD
jgi:hypothetical protein